MDRMVEFDGCQDETGREREREGEGERGDSERERGGVSPLERRNRRISWLAKLYELRSGRKRQGS